MVNRIKAAVDARVDHSFFLIARTDAIAVEGLDSALERAASYAEAGADGIFVEAAGDLGMYRQFIGTLQGTPILANMTEFGRTPLASVTELRNAGVSMVLYPLSAFRAMNKSAEIVYESIRKEGHQENVLQMMQTRDELYDRIRYFEFEKQLEAEFSDGN